MNVRVGPWNYPEDRVIKLPVFVVCQSYRLFQNWQQANPGYKSIFVNSAKRLHGLRFFPDQVRFIGDCSRLRDIDVIRDYVRTHTKTP